MRWCVRAFYGALLNAFSIPLLAHRTLCSDNYPTDRVRVRLFTASDRSSYNGLFVVCRFKYVTTAVIDDLCKERNWDNKQGPFLRNQTFLL